MANKKTSFGKNLITIIIGSASTKLISFLLVPFYTGILSTDEMGSVDIAISTASLLLPLFTGVVFEAALRFALDEVQDKRQVFSTTIYIDAIGILAFLLLSPLALLYEPLKQNYLLFVLYFISLVINDSLSYFARGLNEIRKYTLASIIQTVILCLLNIYFLAFAKIGVQGYFLSYIFSLACGSLFLWSVLRMHRFLLWPGKVDTSVSKNMLKYSIPMIPNTISWWINSSSDRYFVVAMCGISANGIYSVAYKLSTVISLGTSIFNTAWQISAVEDYGTETSKKRFSTMCFNYYSIMLVLSSGIILFTRILSKLLFQQEFFEAWLYVPLLVVAACFHAFSTFIGSVFTTTKKTKYLSYTTFFGAGANIIMNYFFIKAYGVIGAAIATLLSYVLVYISRYYFAQKIYSFPVNIRNDLACMLVLIAQMTIVCLQIPYCFVISAILFALILMLRRQTMISLLAIGKEKIHAIKNRER